MLVVGLGNPGVEYEGTRHNIGANTVLSFDSSWKMQKKVNARTSRRIINGTIVHFAVPETFMNLSGLSVRLLLAWYDLPPELCIVVHDEADLNFGDVRSKFGGGTAGHNGLKSIVKEIGTENFWRVRVGIGRPDNPNAPLDKYVLGRWTNGQSSLLEELHNNTINEIESLIIRVQDENDKSE
jgi:peptidyl-tRNA hydrolase, PTH1 family